MSRMLVLNHPHGHQKFTATLKDLFSRADQVDLAVSYLQMSGWSVFCRHTKHLNGDAIRILTTAQLHLTQPAVLEQAIHRGVTTKCYQGAKLFHPKIYIAHCGGRCVGAVLGSANLSASGLSMGVEAGYCLDDPETLRELAAWFDAMFAKRVAVTIDDAFVANYHRAWKKASAERIRARRRRERPRRRRKRSRKELIAVEVDGLDDILSTVRLPVGTLGFDHAGNNVRNLARARDVLRRFPNVSDKERSELHLLGFAQGSSLTTLGKNASRRTTEKGLATVWCRWIKSQSAERLSAVNPRLLSFKRAASRFWTLKPSVRKEFYERFHDDAARTFVQAVELLCNGSDVVTLLDVNDVKAVAPILTSKRGLPSFLAEAIDDYRSNKGSRSWTTEDRLVVLAAWRDAR